MYEFRSPMPNNGIGDQLFLSYTISMQTFMRKELARALKQGAVGVLPTDTLYGLVASALDRQAVERVYHLRKRNPKKPCIILIASGHDLARFGIRIPARARTVLRKLWPGPISIVLPCSAAKFRYLHRGTKTLAFRMPAEPWLQTFLRASGPLIAPTANREGEPPARTAAAARRIFGAHIDFYMDRGFQVGAPSTLIKILR